MPAYKPFIVGVEHTPWNVEPFLESLDKGWLSDGYMPKSVGIEAAPRKLAPEDYEFWSEVKKGLEKRGITVYPLVTNAFDRQLHKRLFPERTSVFSMMADLMYPTRKINEAVREKKIYGVTNALMSDTLPRILVKSALAKRPEMIVCGALHAKIVRTTLKVPRSKQRMVTNVNGPNYFGLAELERRKVRAFQLARRKQKAKRKVLRHG